MVRLLAVIGWLLSLQASPLAAAPPGFRELAIGDAAPDFKLPGVDDKDHSLSDFAKAKLLVVLFTCNHCPTAQAYEDRIKKLDEDYRDKGVALVAISPNDPIAVRADELGYTELGDTLADMKLRAADQGFKFPYLYDGETQATSLAYGALATPHALVFDQDRKLRYTGRIDDSDVREVTRHDLRNAIDALLAGKPVPVEKTRVFGCSTKWSDKREAAKKSLEKWEAEPVELKSIDEAALAELVSNKTDKYLLINVWATWCGPCVSELPELVEMNRMYRRRPFQLITISMDEPDQRDNALKILQQNHVSCTNYISTIADKDRFADVLDKEWRGVVPYTVWIAPGGKVIQRFDGELNPLEVKRAIVDVIGRTYVNEPAKANRK